MHDNPESLALLPYEFARLNRVLLRPDTEQLVHTAGLENWVINEISRCNGTHLSLLEVENAEFDKLLSRLYQNQQSSSEVVMAGIKDLSILKRLLRLWKNLQTYWILPMMPRLSAFSMPFWRKH